MCDVHGASERNRIRSLRYKINSNPKKSCKSKVFLITFLCNLLFDKVIIAFVPNVPRSWHNVLCAKKKSLSNFEPVELNNLLLFLFLYLQKFINNVQKFGLRSLFYIKNISNTQVFLSLSKNFISRFFSGLWALFYCFLPQNFRFLSKKAKNSKFWLLYKKTLSVFVCFWCFTQIISNKVLLNNSLCLTTTLQQNGKDWMKKLRRKLIHSHHKIWRCQHWHR